MSEPEENVVPLRRMVERPCAEGCGRTVTLEAVPGSIVEARWEWFSKLDPVCDECWESQAAEERRREAALNRQRRVEARQRTSGIPRLYTAIEWAQVDVDDERKEAIEAAFRWGKGELDYLVLGGEVGAGKTFIAAAAAWQRMNREAVKWYSMPKLIASSLGGWDSDERKAAQAALTGTVALVLDDVDKVKATEWTASNLFLAIDNRISEGGSFLVTTNQDPMGLKQMFGDALADRLVGHAEFHVVGGRSRR